MQKMGRWKTNQEVKNDGEKRQDQAEAYRCGDDGAELKVWHEKPMPKVYRELDSDLARDNIENDIPFADLQDIR